MAQTAPVLGVLFSLSFPPWLASVPLLDALALCAFHTKKRAGMRRGRGAARALGKMLIVCTAQTRNRMHARMHAQCARAYLNSVRWQRRSSFALSRHATEYMHACMRRKCAGAHLHVLCALGDEVDRCITQTHNRRHDMHARMHAQTMRSSAPVLVALGNHQAHRLQCSVATECMHAQTSRVTQQNACTHAWADKARGRTCTRCAWQPRSSSACCAVGTCRTQSHRSA